MATRCQVQITSSGLGWQEDKINLYHHRDGDPANMLKLINKAYTARLPKFAAKYPDAYDYIFGRTGKVAALICAADRFGYEVEKSCDLHGDIEWLYLIEAVNGSGKPEWHVKVYKMVSQGYAVLAANGKIQDWARWRNKYLDKISLFF